MDYPKTLYDLIVNLVDDKANLKVIELPSLEENELILHVYASQNDVSKLIGRQGVIANYIRQIMSIPSKIDGRKLIVKFENY